MELNAIRGHYLCPYIPVVGQHCEMQYNVTICHEGRAAFISLSQLLLIHDCVFTVAVLYAVLDFLTDKAFNSIMFLSSQTELSQQLQQLSEKAKGGTDFIQRLKGQTEKVNVSHSHSFYKSQFSGAAAAAAAAAVLNTTLSSKVGLIFMLSLALLTDRMS